jgi:hypothetical protein
MILGLAALALVAAATERPCSAAGATAIALPSDISKQGVSIYTHVNSATPSEAKTKALDGCRKQADSDALRALCKVVATFSNQCVAQAFDPQAGTPGFGWALAGDSVSAKNQALANCRDTAGPTRQDACVVPSNGLWCDGRAK